MKPCAPRGRAGASTDVLASTTPAIRSGTRAPSDAASAPPQSCPTSTIRSSPIIVTSSASASAWRSTACSRIAILVDSPSPSRSGATQRSPGSRAITPRHRKHHVGFPCSSNTVGPPPWSMQVHDLTAAQRHHPASLRQQRCEPRGQLRSRSQIGHAGLLTTRLSAAMLALLAALTGPPQPALPPRSRSTSDASASTAAWAWPS
jgi:hypothetical protein